MISVFWRDWPRFAKRLPRRLRKPLRVALLTGLLGPHVLEPLVERLNAIVGLEVRVSALRNSLYGKSVTVSGLLPGADFDRALRAVARDVDMALIPANAVRPEDDRFLDDLTMDDLRRRHPHLRIEAVPGGAADIADRVLAYRGAEHYEQKT
jgi:NifB/MoaA-like Fe-S oxidoreductase